MNRIPISEQHCSALRNMRLQIFDAEGTFLREWTGIGYPYAC